MFFLIVITIVLSWVLFNDKLIGRALDFTLPWVDSLVDNVYQSSFFTWSSPMNWGSRNTFVPTLIPVNTILYLPRFFGASSWFIGRYQIVLTIFLGLIFFYLFAQKILEKSDLDEKYKKILSILWALFFVLNNYLFCEIIFGSNVMYITFAFFPLFLYWAISYLRTKKPWYFALTLFSAIIISSTLQHFVILYFIFFLLAVFYSNIRFFIKIWIFHFLLSFYWILPILYSSGDVMQNEASADYSGNLMISANKFIDSLINKEYFFNRDLYNLSLWNNILSNIWILNAFCLLLICFLILANFKKINKDQRKLAVIWVVLFVISLFFVKWWNEPFGDYVLWAYQHIKFLALFRSLQHYIWVYVLGISILFMFSSVYLVGKNKKFIYLLALFVIVNSMPWRYTGDFGTKNLYNSGKVPSYFWQYELTQWNYNMYALNQKKLLFSIFHIPPGFSIWFENVGKNNVRLQWWDGGLSYGNKWFYCSECNGFALTNSLSNVEKNLYLDKDAFAELKNFFAELNTRYFVVRRDATPLYSTYAGAFNLENVYNSINKSSIAVPYQSADFVDIYQNDYFLPIFYIPNNIIHSFEHKDKLDEIAVSLWKNIRTAVFFWEQNYKKTSTEDLNFTGSIEYKKINPIKYKIILHNISGKTPFVLSESFSNGWRLYNVKQDTTQSKAYMLSQLTKYKVFTWNQDDQATSDEMNILINLDKISTLWDLLPKSILHKKWVNNHEENDFIENFFIDFISKDFYDSIQNDNLKIWNMFDTFFCATSLNKNCLEIPQENHLTMNAFANAWIVDTDEVCKQWFCSKNEDGSYNAEFIIEYRPQRLFYAWAWISLLTLIILSFYGIFTLSKKPKNEFNP